MDINQLKNLLTRYFEGNTTLEEERYLHRYFATEDNIPVELVTYRDQFMIIREVADDRPDTAPLMHRIGEMIAADRVSMPQSSARRTIVRFLVAASVTLLVGVSALFILHERKPAARDTYSDPQLAYNEAQKALLYISQKMNKGIEPLSNVAKINTGTDKLRSLEKMDESLGMLNLVYFINNSSNLKK